MLERDEVELKFLKATVGKNTKHNIEWTCEGGRWTTILSISQNGTGLSR